MMSIITDTHIGGWFHAVMIWDDKKRKFVYEIGLPSRVVAVRMRSDRLADL